VLVAATAGVLLWQDGDSESGHVAPTRDSQKGAVVVPEQQNGLGPISIPMNINPFGGPPVTTDTGIAPPPAAPLPVLSGEDKPMSLLDAIRASERTAQPPRPDSAASPFSRKEK
jgi:hypothetical protein